MLTVIAGEFVARIVVLESVGSDRLAGTVGAESFLHCRFLSHVQLLVGEEREELSPLLVVSFRCLPVA